MKAEQFKHNLKKMKRINDHIRFKESMEEIDQRIKKIKKLNTFIKHVLRS